MKRISTIIFAVASAMLLYPATVAAQRGGKSDKSTDQVKQAFDMLAKGKPFLDAGSIRHPALRSKLNEFMRTNRVRNGKLTLEDFRKFASSLKTTKPKPTKTKQTDGKEDLSKKWSDETWRDFMNMSRGKKYLEIDRVRSGRMRHRLRDFAKAHNIKNGIVTLEQYRKFESWYRAKRRRYYERRRWERSPPAAIVFGNTLRKKPVVYHVNNLPEDLPAWFILLDISPKDGQVSLSEWRAAKRDLKEYLPWDQNNDGLITPREALRVIQEAEMESDDDRDDDKRRR